MEKNMLLAVDIGNSSVDIGVFDGESLLVKTKFSTVQKKCVDEYALTLKGILALNGISIESIGNAIISSVVHPLTKTVSAAIRKLTGIIPVEVGPGIKTGLRIRIDVQNQLGADIVANAVEATATYEGPVVIVDFGSATTFTVINREGVLDGVIIAPGVRMSLDALASYTSALPDISIESPKRLIAKNTNESMNVGVLYGHAFMIDGFINKICEELGEKAVCAIATGGLSEVVLPYCKTDFIYEDDLTLKGLFRLYKKNSK
jgi:type III pantothenate kinase